MRRVVFCFFSLCVILYSFAKDVSGIVVDNTGEPLVGAEVFWENTTIGTTTDVNGLFTIPLLEQHPTLITSYLGYHNDTLVVSGDKKLTIVLVNSAVLDEVTITEMKAAFLHSRSDIFNTTTLSAAQFCTAACCNLSESFENSASVDVSYSDAATGAKQIRLLGLSGKYVQMLQENTPGIRGLGQTFGMEFIPGPWMNSIQISKGTSSVTNGYEALTGQINIELVKPQTMDPFSVNAMINHELHSELNLMGAWDVGKITKSSLLFHAQGMPRQMDHNHDGFLDMPQSYQVNVFNRWKTQKENYTNMIAIHGVYDRRMAGLTKKVQNNHDVDYDIDLRTRRIGGYMKNGVVFDGDREASIGIITAGSYHSQNYTYGRAKDWNASQLNLYLNAIFQTDLNKHTEESQHHHELKTGLSLNYDLYKENLSIYRYTGNSYPVGGNGYYPVGGTDSSQVIYATDGDGNLLFVPLYPDNSQHFNFDRYELTPGIFAEYTYKYKDKITLLFGVRGDYSTTYGFFFTPRFNFRYAPADWFTLRTNVGLGYRTPSLISDNSGWLASNKTLSFANKQYQTVYGQTPFHKRNWEQEQTLNTGVTLSFYIPIGNKTLQLFAEYYYTKFLKGTFMDLDRWNNLMTHYAAGRNFSPFLYKNGIEYYNLSEVEGASAFSHTYQLEATMEVLRGWSITAAFRYSDARQTSFNSQTGKYLLREIPFQSQYKAILTTTYQTKLKKWQFDLTAQFNGYGRMPDNFFVPENSSQYYTKTHSVTDVYGVQQQVEAVYHKWFPQLMGQVTRYFRNASVYIGAENMTNYMQDSPIQGDPIYMANTLTPTSHINPYSNNFDASSIWAPIHGWKVYVGFRYNLSKPENN